MIHSTKNRAIARSRVLALGVLLVALMAAMLLAARPTHAATTFTVTNTDDSGAGSLRRAIEDANAASGADTIEFDIPGIAVATIAPTSELPAITGPVTINGYSQWGAQPNTKAVGSDAVLKVELSGASTPGIGNRGLRIEAANSTVKGLIINRWTYGIAISGPGATGNKVTGNYIGTDMSGTQDLGNSLSGVYIAGAPNTVGGATAGERNTISGNGYGVEISGSGATGNKVLGNYIGTDRNGTAPLGNSLHGVRVAYASNTTVGGTTAGARNLISASGHDGVYIEGDGNKVTGNYIGTDASGAQDLGNSRSGVRVSGASNNAIGGTTAAERNVISGNYDGVGIEGDTASGNKVTGNHIGTDASGTKDLGNYDNGVTIDAPNNTVGGATAGERNVISGNRFGITIGAGGNKVLGNYIGTGASGTQDLGNSYDGVRILVAPNNTIGGATAGERNVIAANGRDGVVISGDGGDGGGGNKVLGNHIGTDKSGTAPLGNLGSGLLVVGASNNTIGGTQAGARNIICANDEEGVLIGGSGARGNHVLSNSISYNGGLGIDLGTTGLTPNDPGDADTGANNLQNFPVLSSARTSATSTTVQGTLNSTPNTTFLVQFFSNLSGDEGQTFKGRKSVTTDASGNASFTFSPASKVEVGRNMTATATDPGGNTSEFSAPKVVLAQ